MIFRSYEGQRAAIDFRSMEVIAATPQCKEDRESDEEDFIPGTSARKVVGKAVQMQQPKSRQLDFCTGPSASHCSLTDAVHGLAFL